MYKILSPLLIILCAACSTPDRETVSTSPFVKASDVIGSNRFSLDEVNQLIIKRIKEGFYNDYKVDLCVDDSTRCRTSEFEKYRKEPLIISAKDWNIYSDALKNEILNEIIYYTWGHTKNRYNALEVSFETGDAPLDYLNPKSKDAFLVFSQPDYLKGGKGKYAYGPNCWYSTISAVASENSRYSKANSLAASSWNKPRFMGAAEFRCFMQKFEKVESPVFGDVVRYYTDSIYYDEKIVLYNGEVHAANYIGYDSLNKREIVLTKNGRNDLNFLIYQDLKALDDLYLPKAVAAQDPRIKGYYRIIPGSSIFDPAVCGKCSECYDAFKIDSVNYADRLNCLAGTSPPDVCNGDSSCFCFPKEWKRVITTTGADQ